MVDVAEFPAWICAELVGQVPADLLVRLQRIRVPSTRRQRPQVLRDQLGIDIAGPRPRHLDALVCGRFDYVITLCDKAREACPEFADHPRRAHWSIPDPAAAASADQASYPAFARTAANIDTRIRHLLPVLAATDRKEVQP